MITEWVPGHTPGIERLIPNRTATSCERLHLDLWLMHGVAPSGPQSVTVTRFEFAFEFAPAE